MIKIASFLLGLSVGCAPLDEFAGLPDASPSSDAAVVPADAADPTVTVTVRYEYAPEFAGQPHPGVNVIFHNPDGTVIAHAVTDENGQASRADLLPGAMVTLLADETWAKYIFTFADVEPGDDLLYAPTPRVSNLVTKANIAATQSVPGAKTMVVTHGNTLGSFYDVDSLPEYTTNFWQSGMTDDETFNFVAAARDQNDVIIAGAAVLDITPTGEETDVTLPDWSPPGTAQITTPTLPQFAEELELSLWLRRGGRSYGDYVAEQVLIGTSEPTVQVDLAYPDGVSDDATIETVVATGRLPPEDFTRTGVIRHVDLASESSLTLSAADFATRIHSVSSSPTVRPDVVWKSTGDVEKGDVVIVDSFIAGPLNWIAIMAPSSERFVFPELPEELAEYRPDPDILIEFGMRVHVMYLDRADVADFESYKSLHGGNSRFGWKLGPSLPVEAVHSQGVWASWL